MYIHTPLWSERGYIGLLERKEGNPKTNMISTGGTKEGKVKHDLQILQPITYRLWRHFQAWEQRQYNIPTGETGEKHKRRRYL